MLVTRLLNNDNDCCRDDDDDDNDNDDRFFFDVDDAYDDAYDLDPNISIRSFDDIVFLVVFDGRQRFCYAGVRF